MLFLRRKLELPTPEKALPGRSQTMYVAPASVVSGNPMKGPFPEGLEEVTLEEYMRLWTPPKKKKGSSPAGTNHSIS